MRVRTYVLIALVTILMSFEVKNARPSEGVNPGDRAPRIESLENETKFSFQNHSGRYTLLNFWAAYNAESRVRNVQLANEVNKLGLNKVAMYSFSLDEKESVFTETVKIDKLDGTMQLREEQGKKSVLYKKFHRKGEFKNFLIDDQGIIVATDVTPKMLTEILAKI